MPPGDETPDLGIDLDPPVRLYRRTRSGVNLLGEAIVAVARRVLGLVLAFVAFGLVLAFVRSREPPRVVLAPAPEAPARDFPGGQEERDDADDRARLAARALADEEDAREGRLREAARLVNPVTPVIASADLEGGRRQAFLQLHRSGNYYTSVVEAGACRQYPGMDRYHWETGTPEELAVLWACRGSRDGVYRVVSATRKDFGLSAVLVDARGRRWRLEMGGFDAGGGEAVVEMTEVGR